MCLASEPNIACEDLRCITYQDPQGVEFPYPCYSERRKMIRRAMFSIKETSTSATCWVALFCIGKIEVSIRNISCRTLCSNDRCKKLIKEKCPPLIYVPSVPVLFDHVYFVYTKENIIYHSSQYDIPPDYVCYTQHLCQELPTTITLPSLNNATCRHFSEIP